MIIHPSEGYSLVKCKLMTKRRKLIMTRVLFNQNVYLKIGQTLVSAHFSEHAGLTETTSSIKEGVES